jgi:two-component system response regulator RegA
MTGRELALLTTLIVEPVESDRFASVTAMLAGGLQPIATESFEEARGLIGKQPPALLIADVRLGEYNGLHLVLIGKTLRPSMAAIVTASWPDPVLQADAESMGATFVVKPASADELLAAAMRTIYRGEQDPIPVRPPFERRHAERRHDAAPALAEERRHEPRRRRGVGAIESSTISRSEFSG